MPHDCTEIELSFDRPIQAADLALLFAQSDWAASRSLEDLEQMLSATRLKLGVWQDGRLVGFARAITDGRYRALIDDVIVDESMRGSGLGTRMMRHLAQHLDHVDEIFLRCEADIVPFYQRLGYQQRAICLDLVKDKT